MQRYLTTVFSSVNKNSMTKNIIKSMRPHDSARFHSRYKKLGPDDCWIWEGAFQTKGYGYFGVGKNQALRTGAHRIAYALEYGNFVTALYVCHHCDNRKCVYPAQLFLGTHTDNMRDMIKKGRARFQRYPKKPLVKIKKTICKRGHLYGHEDKNGRLFCLECFKIRRHIAHCVNLINFLLS